jgi:hypothetical protein
MELNGYFSQFIIDLYNVNNINFVIDDQNQFCLKDNSITTIVQNHKELIGNVNCDNCLLGCLELETDNLILSQKCIDQVSNRYYIKMNQDKDMVTGEVVDLGKMQGSAMTAKPTGTPLDEIQDMFVLLTKLKLLIYANLNWNCKVRSVELNYNINIESIEASVNAIILTLIQSNSKLLNAFKWLIKINNKDLAIIEQPYRFYANLVEIIYRKSKNIEMWNDISKYIVLGNETLKEFCSRIKNNDEIQDIMKRHYISGNYEDEIIYKNYFDPENMKFYLNKFRKGELGL